MTKKERLNLIVKIIEENEIYTQEELTDALKKSGLDVSQATVSRDINELSLIKVVGMGKKQKYALPLSVATDIPQNLVEVFRHVTVSIVAVNNLIVIKTLSGNANSVAGIIDVLHLPEIMGTVAGDDTLLIVSKTNQDAEKIVKTLKAV